MRRVLWVLLVASVASGAQAASRGGVGSRAGSLFDQVTGPTVKQGGSVLSWVGRYVVGRVADALDMVEVNAAIGPGLKAGVEYAVLRTTVGQVEAQRIGLDGRQVGMWTEHNVAFGIFPVSLLFAPFELLKDQGDTYQMLAEGGFEAGTLGVERTARKDFVATDVLYHEAVMAGAWHERPGDVASVGAEVHLLIVGARARVKPLEIMDFVLGFIGIDLDPRLKHPDAEGRSRH